MSSASSKGTPPPPACVWSSLAEQPPVDPLALLGTLEGIIRDQKPAAGGRSWVGTLIVIAAALIGMAVWTWVSARRGRELAKLRHEKFVAGVKADQAIVDTILLENAQALAAMRAIEQAAAEKLRLIESDIKAEEARYAADLRAIDRIRAWRDLGAR